MYLFNSVVVTLFLSFSQPSDHANFCPKVPETKPVDISQLGEFYAWANLKAFINDSFIANCANFTFDATANKMTLRRDSREDVLNLPKYNENATSFQRKIYLEKDSILIYFCTSLWGTKGLFSETMLIGSQDKLMPRDKVNEMVDFWSGFMNASAQNFSFLQGPCPERKNIYTVTSPPSPIVNYEVRNGLERRSGAQSVYWSCYHLFHMVLVFCMGNSIFYLERDGARLYVHGLNLC